ncbi:hypothetical protein [Nonomuraea sp. NPDC052265]|uniref:hypothetical protein n=1 Tax=Nonomuraea sp. NPDC052265 TaxID=3364374 RepID=UPI0037C889B0
MLESGLATNAWENARASFSDQVLGPHFEEMCRQFHLLELEVLGKSPGEIGAGIVQESDVLAIGLDQLYG